jgi:iron complex outermembrane receptor protein
MKNRLPTLATYFLIAACPGSAHAAIALAQAPDLAELSLEQLTRVTVTSASRREERLIEAPASIFVISAEDIRRSGATSIPEALRLAPNLHVARADNNQYAISARGFNNVLANKMLVLIDGRTVYTPLFSGVFWEAQDTLLSDIERIEVISGPAATLWGANGVNGVISITTLPASRTQGALVQGAAGSRERGVAARFAGALGADGNYRVYAKYFDRDNLKLVTGEAIRDASQRAATGFRADWDRGQDGFTLQGDAYWGDIDQAPEARSISGANLLARWRQQLADNSVLRLQVYYDRTDREHPGTFKEALDTIDVDLQHSFNPWSTHHLVWGGGYRISRDRVENSAAQAFIPADRTLRWGNVFAQDEITLPNPDVQLTLGLKLETNIYTGTEWLPNARLSWHPAPDHLIWGALSRAVRAPSRIDRDVFFPGVAPFALVSNETFAAEVVKVAEIGYRGQLSTELSFSATAFHHEYPNLRSVDLSPALRPVFANTIEGHTDGVEAWGSYRVMPKWRLTGGWVEQRQRRNVIAGQRDLGGLALLGTDPKRTAQLRSAWDITPRHEIDFAVRHVGELGDGVVPAYTVADARIGWRPIRGLELSLVVQNLFDRDYSEWGAAPAARALLERTFLLKAEWKPR